MIFILALGVYVDLGNIPSQRPVIYKPQNI